MRDKNLGDLVYEALEEYSPNQGSFSKLKKNLERVIARNNSKLILGSTVLFSALGYLYGAHSGEVIENLKAVSDLQTYAHLPAIIANNASTVFKLIYTTTGASIGFVTGMLATPFIIGKNVCNKIDAKAKEIKKKKIGKIFRHPSIPSLVGATLFNIKEVLSTPERINALTAVAHNVGASDYANHYYNYLLSKEINIGMTFIVQAAALYALGYIFRDFEHMGKKGIKELIEYFRVIPKKVIGFVSKEKEIELVKKAISKRDSPCLKYYLGRELFKKNIYEGMDYCKSWLEERIASDDPLKFTALQKWSLGIGAQNLFKKKTNQVDLLTFLIQAAAHNPDAIEKIIAKVTESLPIDRIDEQALLTILHEKAFNTRQDDTWAKVALNMVQLSKEKRLVKEYPSTEGKVYAYDGIILLLLKERYPEYFERFLKQRFEYDVLTMKRIKKTEQPCAFLKEKDHSLMLFLREGKQTIREWLQNPGKAHKPEVFEKSIEQTILVQKALFDKVRKEKNEYYVDVNFQNITYSVKLEVLDMEEHLLHKAFLGDERRKDRFGPNVHLDALLIKLHKHWNENYEPIIITVNHGDLGAHNLTDQYTRIDGKHIISDTLYDTTCLSLDPVFLDLKKLEKAEVNFKYLKRICDFHDEPWFLGSFDSMYFVNSLCIAASHKAHGLIDYAVQVLNESLECAKGKDFEKELISYLKESSARELLKAM